MQFYVSFHVLQELILVEDNNERVNISYQELFQLIKILVFQKRDGHFTSLFKSFLFQPKPEIFFNILESLFENISSANNNSIVGQKGFLFFTDFCASFHFLDNFANISPKSPNILHSIFPFVFVFVFVLTGLFDNPRIFLVSFENDIIILFVKPFWFNNWIQIFRVT